MKTAVILAAGLGSRLKELNDDKPKAFLELSNIPLIKRSVDILLKYGVQEIIIGTGFKEEFFVKFATNYPQIQLVNNYHYTETGSLYTLWNLRNKIKNDFLLLESDLLYEQWAIKTLLDDARTDLILCSSRTNSGDEVYVGTDDHLRFIKMSKDPSELHSIAGELVGISKISLDTYQEICNFCVKQLRETPTPTQHYEDGLNAVATTTPLFAKIATGLLWCEIDNAAHLERAKKIVYPRIVDREQPAKLTRNILLNPGPATTTDSVKAAQVVPDICPREKSFGNLMQDISTKLIALATSEPERYSCVLFGGSGTAAVEALISSVVDPTQNKAVLVINNGAYGARMKEMASIYKYDVEEFKSSQYQPINMSELEEFISNSAKTFSHLFMVHHETTTGILNDIQAVGEICAKHKIELAVDTISSYAAVPIDMEKMNLQYIVSTSNKNLQAMPGISFVIAKSVKVEGLLNIPPNNLYLNLYQQYKYFKENSQMRFTPPVQSFYCLKQALSELEKEGVHMRYKRYSKCWQTLKEGLAQLKLETLVDEAHQSKLLTTIVNPHNPLFNFDKLHDYLLSKGITIYPGKLTDKATFRIANIGEIYPEDIEQFLVHLKEYLREICHTI